MNEADLAELAILGGACLVMWGCATIVRLAFWRVVEWWHLFEHRVI